MEDKTKIKQWRLQYQTDNGDWVDEWDDSYSNLMGDIEEYFIENYDCEWSNYDDE
jgi:septation ring formation regulator EzrA|tara:strand:+ start:232 stop:396 length:165 start_codon:yes stop_codon:yes gene_type:complete